jgi:hypothetical protein
MRGAVANEKIALHTAELRDRSHGSEVAAAPVWSAPTSPGQNGWWSPMEPRHEQHERRLQRSTGSAHADIVLFSGTVTLQRPMVGDAGS